MRKTFCLMLLVLMCCMLTIPATWLCVAIPKTDAALRGRHLRYIYNGVD